MRATENLHQIEARSVIDLECPDCQGEGYVLSVGRLGEYVCREATFFPSESLMDCPECGGTGYLEGCGRCLQAFSVHWGQEVCGCTRAALAQAA